MTAGCEQLCESFEKVWSSAALACYVWDPGPNVVLGYYKSGDLTIEGGRTFQHYSLGYQKNKLTSLYIFKTEIGAREEEG